QRRRQARVAVALGEPALHDRVAIGAAQERDLLLMEVFARDIGDHRKERPAASAQIFAELAHARFVAGELRLELERRAPARIEVMVFGGEVQDAAHAQNFILEIASYTGPSTESITQPRMRPSTTVRAGSIIACSRPIASFTSRL